MARVRKVKGKKKYDWMQTKLAYQHTASSGSSPYSDSFYFDVAKDASLINRKLVRQGQLFRIKNLKVWTDSLETYRFKVSCIPTNWVVRNAWVKSKALFDEMNEMAYSTIQPQMQGKYHDYKIYMNDGHIAQTSANTMIPCDADGTEIGTAGSEWTYAKFQDSGATSDEYNVKMLGTHVEAGTGANRSFTTVSLIKAYKEGRIRPSQEEPLVPYEFSSSPWVQLFMDDDQTRDILADRSGYDAPPYQTGYMVGENEDGGFAVGTGTVGKPSSSPAGFTVPAFNAPCGLFRLEIDDTTNHLNANIHVSFDFEILGPMDM